MHVFPLEGQGIDVPKYLIDYYFPESKKINNNFYFEYNPIRDSFINGHADEITLPMYPNYSHYKKNITIDGDSFNIPYLNRLKRKAATLYIKGKIEYISKNRIEIMAIGSKKKLANFERFIKNLETTNADIHQVTSTKSTIFKGINSIELEVLRHDNMVNLKENENHNNHRGFERNELEKDYKDLQEKLIDTENKLAEVKKKSKDKKMNIRNLLIK